MSAARPPLSVVIATTRPWPEIRATLDSLLPQARALGAEVIVGDGDGPRSPGPPRASRPGAESHQPGRDDRKRPPCPAAAEISTVPWTTSVVATRRMCRRKR